MPIRTKRLHRTVWLWIGCLPIAIFAAALWIVYIIGRPGINGATPKGPIADIDFAMSPTRDELVFVGAGRGGSDLFVLDLKTRRVHSLVASPDMEFDPAYSRSGKELVYATSRMTEPSCSLAVLDLHLHKTRTIPHERGVSDRVPSFSPDGSKIVFARASRYRPYSWGGNIWDNWDIYTIGRDGTNLTRITNQPYYLVSAPHFSPDGKSICYSAVQFNSRADDALYTIVASPGGSPVPVNAGAFGSQPEYSPDGRKLLFISDPTRSQQYDLAELSVAGGQPQGFGIVRQSAYNSSPHYSSDGKLVFFLADPNIQNRPRLRLWRMDKSKHSAVEFAGPELFETPLQFVGH